jgi:hypothetical protein
MDRRKLQEDMMRASAVVNRALVATNKGTRYGLGAGGMNPGKPSPAANGKCDCSGFVAWCLGMSRKTREAFYVEENGGWIETTAVSKDVLASTGIFAPLDKPLPGCAVVYGDYKDSNGRHHEGHMAVVTEVNSRSGIAGIDKIVHCSVSNDNSGDAIQETDARIFANNRNSVIGWCILVHEG